MWILTLFGEAISGAHYNPAITLVFMLRRNSSSFGNKRLKGLFYIVAQMLGGLIAGVVSLFLLKGNNKSINASPMLVKDSETNEYSNRVFASMVSELTGSFVFIFLFMLCTDKKTQFSQDKVINCFIMSSAYISARLMAGGCFVTQITGYNMVGDVKVPEAFYFGPLLNPALAFGQIIFSWTWTWWYIYPLMPFFGSIAAVVFYEFVYIKS
jgi:glycerol uptake facilitator-like aquaporin